MDVFSSMVGFSFNCPICWGIEIN